MKNKITYLFLLLIIPTISNAQINTDDSVTDDTPMFHVIKYSPISLVNLNFPSIQFAYERALSKRTSIQYELGGIFIPKGNILFRQELTSIRLLTEHRWYKAPFKKGNNKFQGIGLRLQKQYRQEVEYGNTALLRLTESHSSAGLYYTRGVQRKYNNNLIVEYGAAVGGQYYNVSIQDLPEGSNLQDRFVSNRTVQFNPGNTFVPIAFLVLKVGYDFKK